MKRTLILLCAVATAALLWTGQCPALTPVETYVVNPQEVCEPEWKKNTFKLASWNIEYDNKKREEFTWEERRPLVRALIQRYRFDIIGTQEPYTNMLDDILACSPEYGMVGTSITGEDRPHRKHFNVIFYRKDRFTVLDSGTFWFSETPDEPGTKGWDAYSVRNCNWAKFRDHMTGKEFFHFNMHFDHRGDEARLNSAHLVVQKVREIAGDYPAFMTGDFNRTQLTESYKILREAFGDTYDMATYKTNEEWHSYNGYKYETAPRSHGHRIDHVFLWRQKYETCVKTWKLINDAYNGVYPSDHFPILVEVAFE